MAPDSNPPSEPHGTEPEGGHVHGMALPLPCQACQESPAEYFAGLGIWTGEVQVVLGPDGDLYYATLSGDGQMHRIVSSRG